MNIVLAHGILGFSHLDAPLTQVEYFSGVAEFLRERFKAAVIAPAVDPTAGIETRSLMLRASIEAALTAGQLQAKEPIHIIAHSMGGLDSRRMISNGPVIEANGQQTPIQTLATIGTPHRGSPIADLVALKFLEKIPLLSDALKVTQSALSNVLGHFRISLQGLNDLTTASAELFNIANPNLKTVNYLSYAGGGRAGLIPTSRFFLPYHEIIRVHVNGREASDGVVTVSSATWGTFDPDLWPGDHADEIGHDLDRPLALPGDDTQRRYERVVSRF